jgi:predicted nucleic acid-binding protein
MIYVDTSVLLAQLFAEDERPPRALWSEVLVSSRLSEYELWNRIHARRLADSHGTGARELLGRISLLELSPLVLGRALEPFPVALRTLDALHLASLEHLRSRRIDLVLATYDARMRAAARALEVPLFSLEAGSERG